MPESEFLENAEYKKTPTGRLTREYERGDGVYVEESIDPRVEIKRITETYGGLRRMHIGLGAVKDEETRFLQRVLVRTQPTELRVTNHEGKSGTLLYSRDQSHLVLGLVDSQELEMVDYSDLERKSMVLLTYNRDGTASSVLQAETTRAIGAGNMGEWVEPLPTLVKYYSESEAKREAEKYARTSYYDEKVKIFGNENHPLVQESNAIASRLIQKAIKNLSDKDQEEASRVLEEIGLREQLCARLLSNINIGKLPSVESALRELGGEDEFMNFIITDYLDALSEEEIVDYRRLLKINEFGEKRFMWEEVEIEETAELPHKQKTIQRGESAYGDSVSIQDSTFVLNKDNANVSVNCLKSNNQFRWTAVFPTEIPFEEIKKILDDPNEDFRKIRQLSTATLDLQNKSKK